jgi:O-antigen/teichoic acid export membrane protein
MGAILRLLRSARRGQKWLPDLLIVVGLLALPLLFFAPVTLGGRTLLPLDNLFAFEPWAAHAQEFGAEVPHNGLISDLILENYAWKRFIRQSLGQGELPLWNPHLFAGVPFLAAGQHSALYPFSIIFYLMPLPQAYGWFAVSQLFLAGVLMYLFARSLGVGRAGAAVSAVVYQLCGFCLVSVVFPMIIAGAAWLPLLLLMIEYVIRQRKALGGRPATMPWVTIGALGLGMVCLAGHPEIILYTVLVMGFYAACRLGLVAWREREWGALIRPAVALAAMVGLGMALGGVQLIHLVEALRDNFREGAATLAQVQGWALPWRRLIAFLMPNFFGNPSYHAYYDVFTGQEVPATVNALGQPINTIDWGIKNYVEGGAYLGILTLVLALIGLLAPWLERRRAESAPYAPHRAIFLALALLSFSFMFGTLTYALLYYGIPGISQLHSPFRWIWPFSLSVAILAGFGADALRRMRQARAQAPALALEEWGAGEEAGEATWRLVRWVERALFLGGGGLIALLILSRLLFDALEQRIDQVFHALVRAPEAFADGRMFYSYEFRQVFVLAVFLIGAGLVLRLSRGTARRAFAGLWEPLAVGVIALDLMVALWGFYPAADPTVLDFEPPVVEWLAQQGGAWRFDTFNPAEVDTLNANVGWFYDFDDVRGYDSIIQGQYTRYMALIYPQYQLDFNRVAPIPADHPEALDSPLLDLLNVRYVISEVEIDNPRYEQVYADESVQVYENIEVMPRAFTLPRSAYLCVSGGDAAFAQAVGQFDVRRHAIFTLEEGEAKPGACWPDAPASRWDGADHTPAHIAEHSINQVLIDVEIDQPAYLILADSYYPGWRAFVRPQGAGEEEEQSLAVYRVNGNFRAVYLAEPGAWTVRFRFSPDSLKLGAFATFMAGVVIVFLLGVWTWRYFYREGEDESGILTVARNSLAPIALQLFNRGVDFAFAFVMLRILAPEGAGKYYYAIVIFGWFDILTNFGLNTLLTREVARDRDQANRFLHNTSVLRLGLAGLGVLPLAGFLIARQSLFSPPLAADTILAILLLYAGLVPNSLACGLTALFYAYEKAEYPAAITTVATILKATLGITVLVLGWGIVGLASASVVTNAITLGILIYLGRRLFFHPRAEPDPALRRSMVRESWPLMLNHLLATIFFKLDVLLLEVIRDNVTVGWYSTAYKWLDALNVIPAFLTLGIFPAMSRQAKEDPPALLRSYQLTVKLLVMFALPVAVATTFLAELLINVLGGRAYLPDGAVALRLMIWSIPIGWINSVTNYALIALDRQRALTRAFAVGVVFNLVANLIFMPMYGYQAAAIITICSELVLLAAFYVLLRAALAPVPWVALLWRPIGAAVAMGAVMLTLWPASGPLALGVGVATYLGVLVILRPLSPEEMAQLAPLMPARLRAPATLGRGER